MTNQEALDDIIIEKVFQASIDQVWQAVSTPRGIQSWFMPNDFQPVVGHKFELNGGQFGISPCYVTEIKERSHVSFNWGKDWNITFHLEECSGNVQFTVIHTGWSRDKVTEFGASHAAVRENMKVGWLNIIERLCTYLEK